jgi:hypothetical protein
VPRRVAFSIRSRLRFKEADVATEIVIGDAAFNTKVDEEGPDPSNVRCRYGGISTFEVDRRVPSKLHVSSQNFKEQLSLFNKEQELLLKNIESAVSLLLLSA